MTTTDLSRLALRILDLGCHERAALVATLAQGARRALEAGLLPHPDATECLLGECVACRVEAGLAWVLEG